MKICGEQAGENDRRVSQVQILTAIDRLELVSKTGYPVVLLLSDHLLTRLCNP
jgi:hypothetical protein